VALNTSFVERLNHDPTRLGVSGSPNDMSSPVAGASRRSPRIASVPLQFRPVSSGIKIWTGSQDTSPAGWIDRSRADFERNLLIETTFCGLEECPSRPLRLDPAGHLCHSGSGSGGLATIGDGSTHHRSDRRKRICVDRSLKFPQIENLSELAWLALGTAERCCGGLQDFVGQFGIIDCSRKDQRSDQP
jgi:hypothetical protein